MNLTQRNEEIIRLRSDGVSVMKIGKKYGISHQRVVQIWARKFPGGYSKNTMYVPVPYSPKTINLPKKKRAEDHKIWTKERRKLLGLPDGYVGTADGDGRNFIRELVRMRDEHTCQSCGKMWEKGKRRFDVHHQDPEMEGKSSKRGIIKLDKENLNKMITYCHKCHFAEHSVRERIKIGRRNKA